jgi:hypothetical protein
MATSPTAAFCRSDFRYAALEACARALFPGAVLVPVYGDAAKADLDEAGNIKAEAVPDRIELRFMPPPGLDFDSRHPAYGVMRLEDAVRDIRAGFVAICENEESQCLPPPAEGALASRRTTTPI